jgi:hypothetical protein
MNKGIENTNEQYLKDSKKRLLEIIEKKFKTTFIGALSEFERKFGVLWGDKNYGGSLTKAQIMSMSQDMIEELWLEARDHILTQSNKQMKSVFSEIEEYYTVYWERYRLNFKVKGNN